MEPIRFDAAVLRAARAPLSIERVEARALGPDDVLVRMRAAGLCHTDLEVIEGQLVFPLPMVLGHEGAGVVERVGTAVRGLAPGDHVIIHWNPHCGHCFYCDRDQPILCETYVANGAKAVGFDGAPVLRDGGGATLHNLMYIGAFGEYCVVPAQSAVRVAKEIPFEAACLIGCGVMTGLGAATRIAGLEWGSTVMVIGCGAVGLSAVQGARLAGAGVPAAWTGWVAPAGRDARSTQAARPRRAGSSPSRAGNGPRTVAARLVVMCCRRFRVKRARNASGRGAGRDE